MLTLKSFYSDLHARVHLWPGAESRDFPVQRGVRQGDPLSTLLFNLVMRDVLEEVGATWSRRGYGTDVGSTSSRDRLTHVAFADDVTLIASSWISLKRMVLQLRDALKKRGLALHPSKCKAQTNDVSWSLRGSVPLDTDYSLEVLPESGTLTVLGTELALQDVTQYEIPNRIAAGWRLFWSMKALLMNTASSVKSRLRLFNSTVGSCVLWCTESWTPKVEEMRVLNVARRSMLRRIVGARRASEEDYLEWIQRATRKAERLATAAGVRNWVEAHRAAKWSWAGHVARRPATTWVWRVSSWRDSEWQALAMEVGSTRPLRPSRRRWMKWEYDLHRFCSVRRHGCWMTFARRRDNWANAIDDFLQWSTAE